MKYLPDPGQKSVPATNLETEETVTVDPLKKGKLSALAFKVVNDNERGLVTFFRVYRGVMKNRAKLRNANTNETERIQALLRVKADETQLLSDISCGDIGAIVGCKNIRSGDTIIEEEDTERLILHGLKMPPPVFFCTIEAESSRD